MIKKIRLDETDGLSRCYPFKMFVKWSTHDLIEDIIIYKVLRQVYKNIKLFGIHNIENKVLLLFNL